MFTDAQKKRLKALLALEETKRSADEATELQTLLAAAKTAGYDPAKDVEPMDEAAVSKMVKDAVEKAMKEGGLTPESLAAEVKKLIPTGENLTAEKISEIVGQAVANKSAAKDFDAKALAAELTKALPGQLTEEKIGTMIEAGLKKHVRPDSRMEHQAGDIEMPIAHRAGNLSVAAKQLLNVCLMGISDDAIEKGKSIRPKNMNEGIPETMLKEAQQRGDRLATKARAEAAMGMKALTSTGAGTGLELMNIDISSDLQTRLYLASQIAAAFAASELQMPADPFPLPMTTTRPQFYGAPSQGTGGTASQPGTSAPTLASVKMIGTVPYSYEADEDSIVAILPMLQAALGSGGADALEGVLVNGDTAGSHQDSDIQAVSNHASKLLNGLRKLALAGGSALTLDLSTGGISASNIKNLRKLLKKYGIKPSDVLLLCGTSGYNDLVGLPETLTVQNVGAGARILTGVAPSIYGMDIIPSSQIREDLNASGVYDASTVTKGSVILVHKPSWIMGVRRGFTVESFRDVINQKNTVVASFRRAFIPLETPSATVPIVAMGYNYTA